MDFAAALEEAIALSRKRALRLAVASTVGAVVLGAVLVLALNKQAPVLLMAVLIALVWVPVLYGTPTSRTMQRLRGAAPASWLPSPSHGVVALQGDHLVAGGLPVSTLDRHAERRISSVSYDEAQHALTVFIQREINDGNGSNREATSRHAIRLAAGVSQAQAYAFAKQALGLTLK